MGNSYREKIYEVYGTNFQDAPEMLSDKRVANWKKGYKYYFHNWLPQDKDAMIVEVGCGNGRMLSLLQDLGYANITGVDISPEQIQFARKFNVKVEQANVLDWLENHPNSFDLIIGLDIIEHFEKPEVIRFLEGCFKSMKEGGTIIFQTPNAESPMGLSYRYHDFTHEVAFRFITLARLLLSVGFRNISGKEVAPILFGYSLLSSIRNIFWRFIRLGILFWNYVEIGNKGSGIYTRNFLIKAEKRMNS